MKQKTAMMVMIQGIDTASELYVSKGLEEAYKALIPIRSLAEKLLKEEKEQIELAYDSGYIDGNKGNPSTYYNQTYLEESNEKI